MTEELKTEFHFPLTTSFSYAHSGESVEASFIQLTAPSSRNSRECAALEQAFFRAVPKDQDTADAGDAAVTQPTGRDVITIMAMSTKVDLPDVIDVAKKLFTSGVATVDGETKLTKSLLDKMSNDDLKLMLGEYLVNFILASSLESTRETSSKESST